MRYDTPTHPNLSPLFLFSFSEGTQGNLADLFSSAPVRPMNSYLLVGGDVPPPLAESPADFCTAIPLLFFFKMSRIFLLPLTLGFGFGRTCHVDREDSSPSHELQKTALALLFLSPTGSWLLSFSPCCLATNIFCPATTFPLLKVGPETFSSSAAKGVFPRSLNWRFPPPTHSLILKLIGA